MTAFDLRPCPLPLCPRLLALQGDISSEPSISSSIATAKAHFGPINILCANAGVTDESCDYPIWETPTELWDRTYNANVKGTFLTIKHFLRSAEESQKGIGAELENLAIVVTGSETGKFGQAGHTEYASGKAGLQYGLVRGVKNEIVRLNSKARINAVAPGWVDTPLIEGRLDDPKEMWAEAQATVPLRKIAKPEDVARAVSFLASHVAAGHITGECLSVDGGMEGRVVWREEQVFGRAITGEEPKTLHRAGIPSSLSPAKARPTIKICITCDFDAVSGHLGTGQHPDNNMNDYSAGFFSARVGVPRLLKLFTRLGVADKVTWFMPGHSMESFPAQTKAVIDSGCEIALHGYTHEGAGQMTEEQERAVVERCIAIAQSLTGKKPSGWRAPLYQIREHTLALLHEHGFLYDSSLAAHDISPYFLPLRPEPVVPPDFSPKDGAEHWMHPLAPDGESSSLVEIPSNWYMEDMTPMQFYPHTPNSHGYVDARVIERMWRDRFDFIVDYGLDEVGDGGLPVFPLTLHPDTSGMAHVIGMVERVLTWLKGMNGREVEFCTMREVAEMHRESHRG